MAQLRAREEELESALRASEAKAAAMRKAIVEIHGIAKGCLIDNDDEFRHDGILKVETTAHAALALSQPSTTR